MLRIVALATLFLLSSQTIWAAGTQQGMLAQMQGAATAVLFCKRVAVTFGTIWAPA